ncbi:UvrD-helicase domain-containing protein [Clostridium butyricum]|uniref:UvrD-helicase domain-containing protein n=1 Tax=Clostridium butyricum TaxID=1492 RepID=UPI002011B4D5|nr:UvrD-helicase domain-containing protein [Clostridium butyricum]
MIDVKPKQFKCEGIVWDAFLKNLPMDIIVYNHREIKAREFDFCLLIKNIGIVIVEVKGWDAKHIFDVAGVDRIIIDGYSEPQTSPKKQARAYRFAMINMLKDKFNVSPLVLDMVCYPYISETEYNKKRLDIVSEKECTILKEDLSTPGLLGIKINNLFNKYKNIQHDNMDEKLLAKIRQHFEPTYNEENKIIINNRKPYSKLIILSESITQNKAFEIISDYFKGIKMIIFVKTLEDIEFIQKLIIDNFSKKNISFDKNNLNINSEIKNLVTKNIEYFKIFNLEIYLCKEDISNGNEVIIIEGCTNKDQAILLDKLSCITKFNSKQYYIEHADNKKNILVKAGAGTGKTYSMVSRIAFLCNKSNDEIIKISDEIAMVTFTNEAADNMKSRLKQLFINYYILTNNSKYLQFIEDINQMQISTIHKFAKSIIQSASFELGLGNEFSISSSDYVRESFYEKYLNKYIMRKLDANPNFNKELPLPIHKFKKILMLFANQLYNKSIDIKTISKSSFGKPIELMPYFNEVIEEVIINAEKEYKEELIKSNKIDLRESMILLNQVINNGYKNKCNLHYKYLFIDEFQDTDDVQIDSFLKLQDIIGFKLFVVGDIKQSIYRFRGATVSAFNKLINNEENNQEWNEFSININYRTDSRLLERFDKIFSCMGRNRQLPFSKDDDTLISSIDTKIDESELIKCVSYNTKEDDDFFDVLFDEIDREKSIIEKLSENNKLSREERTIALLVRENWQINEIVKEAKKRNILIETEVGGDLYQLPPALDLYKLVLALNNAREPVYLYNLLNSNNMDISFDVYKLHGMNKEEKIFYLSKALDKFYEARMNLSWSKLINKTQTEPVLKVLKNIYDYTKPWKKYSDNKEKQRFYKENYDLILEKIIKNYSIDYLTINSICNSLKISIITKQEELSRNLVNNNSGIHIICTTIHKSKGLEYGTVVLPYTNQAIDNLKKANLDVNYENGNLAYSIKIDDKIKQSNSNYHGKEEIEQRVQEESRVLYVALTRSIRNFVWLKDNKQKAKLSWRNILEEQ